MPVYRRNKNRKARMPPTRYTPPNKKRRQAYKKSNIITSGTNPSNHVYIRGIGMPDKLTTNLVYTDSFVLDPSAGTITPSKRFRWNSLFDPDYETGGGQPTYFDQIAQIYQRYIVNGAKMTCMFSRSSTTGSGVGPYICGVSSSFSTSLATTDAGQLISTPNCNFAIVADQDGTKTVTATYSQNSVFDGQITGSIAEVTSNPSSFWFGHVFASPQGTDVETPINCVIIIEYNATFSDMKTVVDA